MCQHRKQTLEKKFSHRSSWDSNPKTFPPSCHCSPGSVVTYAFAKEYLLTASLSRLQVAGGGERPGHSDAGVTAVPTEEVPEEDDLQRR